jgi:hypothetical protein
VSSDVVRGYLRERQYLWIHTGYKIYSVSLATFTTTEFNKMFWDRQLRQAMKALRRFRD